MFMAHLVCVRVLDKPVPLHSPGTGVARVDITVIAQGDVFVFSPAG